MVDGCWLMNMPSEGPCWFIAVRLLGAIFSLMMLERRKHKLSNLQTCSAHLHSRLETLTFFWVWSSSNCTQAN